MLKTINLFKKIQFSFIRKSMETATSFTDAKRELSSEDLNLDAKKLKVDEVQNGQQEASPIVETNTEKNEENLAQKINKKRKYALLIGYCGEGYFGLQRSFSIIKNLANKFNSLLVILKKSYT